MKYDFRTPPRATPDKAISIPYPLIPPKEVLTTTPPTAAEGDGEVMGTPENKS